MTTKMVFHGSDIEKICAYYHLNKEDIVKFGANVNPLGLSASVKKEIAENIDLPAYPRACTKAYSDPRTDLFRIFKRTFFLRKHPGILSSTGRTKFHSGRG